MKMYRSEIEVNMFDLKLRIGTEHVFWLIVGYLLARLFSGEAKTPEEAAALDSMFSGDEFKPLMEEEAELENDYQEYEHGKRVANLSTYAAKRKAQ